MGNLGSPMSCEVALRADGVARVDRDSLDKLGDAAQLLGLRARPPSVVVPTVYDLGQGSSPHPPIRPS